MAKVSLVKSVSLDKSGTHYGCVHNLRKRCHACSGTVVKLPVGGLIAAIVSAYHASV